MGYAAKLGGKGSGGSKDSRLVFLNYYNRYVANGSSSLNNIKNGIVDSSVINNIDQTGNASAPNIPVNVAWPNNIYMRLYVASDCLVDIIAFYANETQGGTSASDGTVICLNSTSNILTKAIPSRISGGDTSYNAWTSTLYNTAACGFIQDLELSTGDKILYLCDTNDYARTVVFFAIFAH